MSLKKFIKKREIYIIILTYEDNNNDFEKKQKKGKNKNKIIDLRIEFCQS